MPLFLSISVFSWLFSTIFFILLWFFSFVFLRFQAFPRLLFYFYDFSIIPPNVSLCVFTVTLRFNHIQPKRKWITKIRSVSKIRFIKLINHFKSRWRHENIRKSMVISRKRREPIANTIYSHYLLSSIQKFVFLRYQPSHVPCPNATIQEKRGNRSLILSVGMEINNFICLVFLGIQLFTVLVGN